MCATWTEKEQKAVCTEGIGTKIKKIATKALGMLAPLITAGPSLVPRRNAEGGLT